MDWGILMKKRDEEMLLGILQGYQESLDTQLKMIQDLIRLNQNCHDRLLYLEAEVAGRL